MPGLRNLALGGRLCLTAAMAALISVAASAPSVAADAAKPAAKAVKAKAPRIPNLTGVWVPADIETPPKTGFFVDPPMSAKGKATIDAFRAQYVDLDKHQPNVSCVEPGMPTAMAGIGLQPMDVHQAPDRINIISEVGPEFRRIFMDGRQPPDGYPTTRGGWSNGHWEGQTLVVETQLLQAWLLPRWPHTDDAHVTERFTLKPTASLTIRRNQPLDDMSPMGPVTLVEEITMHDPALYDVDPKGTIYFRKLTDADFLENSCTEGLYWEYMNNAARKDTAPTGITPTLLNPTRPDGK